MPIFSIIIPLYNKEAFIADTLNSALSQTFTDFEIIVTDDGSTDNGPAIVKSHTDPRIVYKRINNSGVSVARNTGIEIARGEIIAFLDADDYWEPQHLETLYKLYIDNPAVGMLTARYMIRIGKGMLKKPFFQGIDDNYSGIIKDAFYSSLINRVAVTSDVAVPKHVFSKTGMFNENVTHFEDTELWIKITNNYPVAITNQYTMVYNFDIPESLSREKMKYRKIMDFTQFTEEEKNNKSLKAFIDIYRIEYALKYRIEGDLINAGKLYRASDASAIHYKTKFLFMLPPFVLRSMLFVKHWLHRKGIAFSVYN
ncbi:glycosyltransferase family 2 protein [Flavobacterium psychrotrophum]|uniref:glycosyltransferase family 2 protein n=1 Tax=Flavobacterium psychrotrophum TaxID=2294119 RepID=UPI0019696829|nr:glycosyltransferase family 2 protein [Flavobacterium psychrotrophum]